MKWLKAVAVVAMALSVAPVVGAEKTAAKKEASAKKAAAKKKGKKAAMENKQETTNHGHREHQEGGSWTCKLAKVPPPGHACTFRSHTPGKCGWCGGEMVKVEDLEKESRKD